MVFLNVQAIISNLGDNVSKKIDRVNNETINNYKPKIKKMTNHEKLYYTSLKSFEENILIGNDANLLDLNVKNLLKLIIIFCVQLIRTTIT